MERTAARAEAGRALQLHRLRQAFRHQKLDREVLAKLGEKHWMFPGANAKRIEVIRMCADCRVEAVVNEGSTRMARRSGRR